MNQTQHEIICSQQGELQRLNKERLEIQSCAEQALAHLGDSGNGSRHDPSWSRPMKMNREEITASCIQAYHQIHRILEILAAHKPS